jgi:hypothetical protein
MAHEIDLGGTIYVSSKRAAEMTGYTQDYVGQLARAGSIQAQRVSGHWYVTESSVREYKEKADQFKPEPPKYEKPVDLDTSVSFDGKDYISAQRASKVTGYHQDYVGQLARSGKVLSRQIGNRWYVDREGIVEHKKYNDELLAAVQTESVGLARPEEMSQEPQNEPELHYTYAPTEEPTPLPSFQKFAEMLESEPEPISELESDKVNDIPIRVVRERTIERMPQPRQYLQSTLNTYSYSSRITIFLVVFLIVLSSGIGGAVYFGKLVVPAAITNIELPTFSISHVNNLAAAGEVSSYLPESVMDLISNELVYKRSQDFSI